jgi:hypothetical protein
LLTGNVTKLFMNYIYLAFSFIQSVCMTSLFKRISFFCFLAFINLQVYAQSAQKMDSMMNLYRDNFPQEKIHVHFDKNYYNPGETIWFKAYVLSGANLSDISKNFYAELINDKGMVMQRIVAPILGSSAASSFTIPVNFNSQYVHFRAFTSWMLNFDTSFLFNKNIRIISAGTAAANALVGNSSLLQLFPEGGDLVADIETKVAFKANDMFGLPVKVKGYIKSADGKKLNDFVTGHDGLGAFTFTPAKGQTYSAVWKDSTNKENTTALPEVKNSGMVLNVTNAPRSVTFIVKRSESDDLLKQVYLVAHMDQQMVYRARINLTDNFLNSGRIPVDQLPTGILQLTLFNSKWQPMAERIVFVNNNDYIFDAYMSTLSKNLNRRGKNTIEVEIPDTLQSNLSLAVTDAGIDPLPNNEENIYSRLLLTDDIRGYVHNPAYYFASPADSVAQQLDLVMLTHGWRRFNWDDLAKGKFPTLKFQPDNYITLKGNVVGGVGNAGNLADKTLNLIVQLKDSTSQFLSVPVKAGGKFTTEPMVFYDTAKVFYQLNKDKRQGADNIIVTLDNGLQKGHSQVALPAGINDGLSPLESTAILNNRKIFNQNVKLEADRTKRAKMLQEVIVKGKIKTAVEKTDDLYTSGLFKGGDGYSFDLTTDLSAASAMTLFNYLQGRVPGLQISNPMSPTPTLSWRGGTPDLFLNEMHTDASGLSTISMADIAYIKVFRPPFMGATGGGAGGAIAVYTKKGGPSNNANFVGLSKVTINGYTPFKEFYSPNYSVDNPLDALDDIRTTLFWQPYIFLNKDRKKMTLTFYNNDISKRLKVVIEGVNERGKLTRVESFIQQ